ncbi:nucleotidyltransferase family protein [Paenibacillus rhizoplanae]
MNEQQQRLTELFIRDTLLMDIFKRAQGLAPFPYYIGAGCLVQTVWNERTGREPGYGISDIDIIYYDASDLSYAAEDEVIAKGRELFLTVLPFRSISRIRPEFICGTPRSSVWRSTPTSRLKRQSTAGRLQ